MEQLNTTLFIKPICYLNHSDSSKLQLQELWKRLFQIQIPTSSCCKSCLFSREGRIWSPSSSLSLTPASRPNPNPAGLSWPSSAPLQRTTRRWERRVCSALCSDGTRAECLFCLVKSANSSKFTEDTHEVYQEKVPVFKKPHLVRMWRKGTSPRLSRADMLVWLACCVMFFSMETVWMVVWTLF